MDCPQDRNESCGRNFAEVYVMLSIFFDEVSQKGVNYGVIFQFDVLYSSVIDD